MRKQILFKDVPLVYEIHGSGPVVVFLHGYLESAEIWKPFHTAFTDSFCTILPDLPGHGGSGVWGEEHSMEDLASAVLEILDREAIDRVLLLGHSMGGYVAMAFAEQYSDRLSGLGLLHSTCFADSAEKKENREREIALVRCGKKQQIISVNIPRAFSEENIRSLSEEVARAKDIASATSDEGIIALLNGMKNRKDHSETLAGLNIPVLLVYGEKDNYIGTDVFKKLSSLVPQATVVRLKESGHMGFVEEAGKLAEVLMEFAASLK